MCQEESGPEEALFHRPRTTRNGHVGFLLSGDCLLPTAYCFSNRAWKKRRYLGS
jgi:hypothetical protein